MTMVRTCTAVNGCRARMIADTVSKNSRQTTGAIPSSCDSESNKLRLSEMCAAKKGPIWLRLAFGSLVPASKNPLFLFVDSAIFQLA
jgi:hypothetical protein